MKRRFIQIWKWIDEHIGISEVVVPLAKHLVPPGSKWFYVFGSATLASFLLQVITGVGLSLLYQPTSDNAYESLRFITQQAPLGDILRGIHFYGASAMILLIGIHMIRVYVMAAYKHPREVSWLSGVILLGLTITMGFTGQLLRWDNNGVWSAVVAAEQMGRIPFIGNFLAHFILGGDTIGGATLSRFFAFHVFLIPALLFGLIGLHVFLVFRNGISEPPEAGRPVEKGKYRIWYQDMVKERGVPFWPDAAWRDLLFGIGVVFVILALGVIFGAPEIAAPPSPADIHSNPRPDWYLLWVFALFALMPRMLESYVIAFAPLVGVVLLLLMPFIFGTGERSPLRRPWSMVIVLFMIMMVGVLWVEGKRAPWSPRFDSKPLPASVIGPVDSTAAAGGRLFYKKGCQFCHTISGYGGIRGPNLTNVGDKLNGEEMTIRIVNGATNMPAFGAILSKKELSEIVAFLKTRKRYKQENVPQAP